MRHRHDPWKWPACSGFAVGLMLAAALWLPRSWLGFLLAPSDFNPHSQSQSPPTWQQLLPPPIYEPIVAQPDDAPEIVQPEPLPQPDPRWWADGWQISAATDEALFAPVTADQDTLQWLMESLGLNADFMTRTEPDSVLAERLFLLRIEEGFDYDSLKPYLTQLGRAKDYADIMSRAADMYDEHLAQEIQVPD